MAEAIWKTGYCEYDIEEGGTGQVKVTTLHWLCSKTEGLNAASSYGTIDASEQSRVYTLPALQNVPESVMTGWVQQALGAEEVARIETDLDNQLIEQATPTHGGLSPAPEEVIT